MGREEGRKKTANQLDKGEEGGKRKNSTGNHKKTKYTKGEKRNKGKREFRSLNQQEGSAPQKDKKKKKKKRKKKKKKRKEKKKKKKKKKKTTISPKKSGNLKKGKTSPEGRGVWGNIGGARIRIQERSKNKIRENKGGGTQEGL